MVDFATKHRLIAALLALAISAAFAIDSLTPPGIVDGIGYAAVMMLCLWLPDHRAILATAILCTALTISAQFLSPPGGVGNFAWINRTFAVITIWIVATLLYQHDRIGRGLTAGGTIPQDAAAPEFSTAADRKPGTPFPAANQSRSRHAMEARRAILKLLPPMGGVLVAIVGASVLVGWHMNSPSLTAVLPGTVAMRPITAVGFVLSGAALFLLHYRARAARVAGFASATVAGLIGVLTVVENVSSCKFGIDKWLFDWITAAHGAAAPVWQMSLFAGSSFALFVAMLLTLEAQSPWLRRISVVLGASGLTIVSLAVIGYVYDMNSLYEFMGTQPTALHTAASFFVLFASAALAAPDRGWVAMLTGDSVGKVMMRRLLLSTIAVLLIVGFLVTNSGHYESISPNFGIAILALSTVILFSIVVWRSTTFLDQMDADRRGKDEALRASQAMLATAESVAGVGSWDWDIQRNKLIWSEEHYRLFGFPPDPVYATNENWLVRVHPDDKNRVREATDAATFGHQPYDIDYRIILPDGSERILNSKAEVFRDEVGQAVHMLGTIHDLTVRKRAEEALRESEGRLHQAVRISNIGIFDHDQRTGAIYWSPEQRKIYGWSPDEIVTLEKFYRQIHPQDLQRVRAAVRRAQDPAVDIPFNIEHRILRRDGEIRWLTARAHTFFEGKGAARRAVRTVGAGLDITERKLSEELLRTNEERFRGIFEQAAMGIGLVAPDGQFLQVNRKLADLLGYTREEMLRLTIRDITHPDDVLGTTISRSRLLEQKTGNFTIEKRYRHKDGALIWVRVTVSLVSDEAGQAKYLIGMVEDITAEREMSEAVKRSQARLDSAQRIARLGSWDHDLLTNRVTWSDEMYRIYGIERQQFGATYEAFLAYVHPDDRKAAAEAAARSVADHKPYGMQFRIRRPDGQERIVHSQAETYFDDTGRPVRRSGSAQDVTERVQAEEALRRSEDRLRQVVRISDIGIFDHDQRTDTIYWSPQQREIYGWDPDEPATLQKYFDCVYPEDREQIIAAVRRAHDPKGNVNFDIEHRIVRRDGEIRWITTRAHTFFEGEGAARRPVRTVGAALDNTEHKHAEEVLRDSEMRLRQAQKMEALGQLTGGIAHDFNNLLSVIMGNLELILERAQKDTALKKLAQAALDGSLRGAKLTQRLLAYSRKQSLQPKVINLSERLPEINTLLRPALGEQINIVIDAAADLWPVCVDPSQIDDLILNLALNARDAMPKGGTLTIEAANVRRDDDTAPDLASGDYVQLTVSDTGTGMPPEVLERAFEPFFTTKGIGKGSGLGLSMVYGFVKQSKGHIKIYSEVGHGTTVNIYLPRAEATSATEVAPSVAVVDLSTNNELILVVEDNDEVRNVVVKQLADLGYRALEAETGEAALDLIDRHKDIDLVLSDVVMRGGMDGYELARQARRRRAGLGILLMSGFTMKSAMDRFADSEDFELLKKPYRKHDLALKLRQLLTPRGVVA
ncbi:MAG: PAS domain-containing protein [Alphaproteobacteria bacterium]